METVNDVEAAAVQQALAQSAEARIKQYGVDPEGPHVQMVAKLAGPTGALAATQAMARIFQ